MSLHKLIQRYFLLNTSKKAELKKEIEIKSEEQVKFDSEENNYCDPGFKIADESFKKQITQKGHDRADEIERLFWDCVESAKNKLKQSDWNSGRMTKQPRFAFRQDDGHDPIIIEVEELNICDVDSYFEAVQYVANRFFAPCIITYDDIAQGLNKSYLQLEKEKRLRNMSRFPGARKRWEVEGLVKFELEYYASNLWLVVHICTHHFLELTPNDKSVIKESFKPLTKLGIYAHYLESATVPFLF